MVKDSDDGDDNDNDNGNDNNNDNENDERPLFSLEAHNCTSMLMLRFTKNRTIMQ